MTTPASPSGLSVDGEFLAPDDLSPAAATFPLGPATAAIPTSPTTPDTGVRYHAHAEIARGAMGAVFRGRDTLFGRPVAIKLLLDEHLHRAELRWRFAEEVRITAALQHPSVVPVYDSGTCTRGRPFYVMRLIRGETLDDAICRYHNTPLSHSKTAAHSIEFRDLLGRFVTACQTLAYAHNRGVLHRDIKPQNV
ncbi:MAG TPA: serine/threonine-protein kinase, partial [Urbifossiella sp.]|nr:serine/threonine-protein kinase [Urbifossiella sp.]